MKLQWIKKILSDYANKQNSVRGLGEKKKREKERACGKTVQGKRLQARSRQEDTAQLLF